MTDTNTHHRIRPASRQMLELLRIAEAISVRWELEAPGTVFAGAALRGDLAAAVRAAKAAI